MLEIKGNNSSTSVIKANVIRNTFAKAGEYIHQFDPELGLTTQDIFGSAAMNRVSKNSLKIWKILHNQKSRSRMTH